MFNLANMGIGIFGAMFTGLFSIINLGLIILFVYIAILGIEFLKKAIRALDIYLSQHK